MAKWNLIIYAPAYNVERQIGEFLAAFRKLKADLASHDILLRRIIIVDDGSTDATNRIISDFAEENDFIRVLRNERNIGPLSSLLRGMHEASSVMKKERIPAESTIVVRIDTDMEHDPSKMPLLLEPVASGKSAMSVGVSDFRDYQLSIRIFNRYVGSWESRRFLGEEIPQFCPGFYALRGDAFVVLMAKVVKAQEIFKKEFGRDMLTIDFVILALAKRAGFKLSKVPLPPVNKKWAKKSQIGKMANYFGYHSDTMRFLGRHIADLCRD